MSIGGAQHTGIAMTSEGPRDVLGEGVLLAKWKEPVRVDSHHQRWESQRTEHLFDGPPGHG